jgi:hypothetical protein
MARTRNPMDVVALQVRLPEAMRAQIAAAAEHNKRSLNGEILFRLSETMDNRWTEYVAALERQTRADAAFMERLRQDPEKRAILDQLVTKLTGNPKNLSARGRKAKGLE